MSNVVSLADILRRINLDDVLLGDNKITPEHFIDNLECDTEVFNVGGLVYVTREIAVLYSGVDIQKSIERLYEFGTTFFHAEEKNLYEVRYLEQDTPLVVNRYNVNNSVTINDPIGRGKVFLKDVMDSRVFENYYDNPVELQNIIDDMKKDNGNITIPIVDQFIKCSKIKQGIREGSRYTYENILQSKPNNPQNEVIDKYKKIRSLLVPKKETYDDLYINPVSINLAMIFNLDNVIDKLHPHALGSIIFAKHDPNQKNIKYVFFSINHFNKWIDANKHQINDMFKLLEDIDSSSSTTNYSPVAVQWNAVLKNQIVDLTGHHFFIGMSDEEIRKNVNLQKLYSDGTSFLKKYINENSGDLDA